MWMKPASAMFVATLALTGCNRELGYEVNTGDFGNSTMNNTGIQSGDISFTQALGQRFAQEVPTTVNFAFNSSQLDSAAMAILTQQANWIRQFPEVRFRVYGHTDLVGSQSYNYTLGKRRAEAVVAFLSSQGISRSRLEALVSFGKTRPLVQTSAPELLNRRTVTEVSGFVKNHPTVLNGKYAAVVFREYVEGATRPHPANRVIQTQTDPGEN
jgi:outer membrane protein OmpA-like peptidoglycan-associated protein